MWIGLLFGWVVHVAYAFAKRIGVPKSKLFVNIAQSLAVYDENRREVSFLLPDDTWVACRLVSCRGNEFTDVLQCLQEQFGDRMSPGRFGKFNRRYLAPVLVLGVFVLAAAALALVLFYAYGH